jgi:hypothetical protein
MPVLEGRGGLFPGWGYIKKIRLAGESFGAVMARGAGEKGSIEKVR